jgi:hypothetical protein
LQFLRLDHPLEQADQLLPAFEAIRQRCRQTVRSTADAMLLLLAKKVASQQAAAIVGVREPFPDRIQTLHVLEIYENDWLGTRFASITLAWSGSRMSQRDYAALTDVLSRGARAVGMQTLCFNSGRSVPAFKRVASRLGFKIIETAQFEKEV